MPQPQQPMQPIIMPATFNPQAVPGTQILNMSTRQKPLQPHPSQLHPQQQQIQQQPQQQHLQQQEQQQQLNMANGTAGGS